MTADQIMTAIGFFMLVLGAIFGFWRYIETKLRFIFDRTDKVEGALAAHKLHVAETYVTKVGMQEQTAQVMRAIEGVGSRIDGMNDRLDRLYEQPLRRN